MSEIEFGFMDALKGTAFRPGDVVILKLRRDVHPEALAVMRKRLRPIEEETGVRFVVLSQDIDVVLADKEEA